MKKKAALFLSLVMFLSLPLQTGYTAQAKQDTVFTVGESIHGYTVVEKGYYNSAKAETIVLEHEKSGATVLCIKNNDPNLACSIGYKTPHTDESDRNHVFEHAICASSKKYPSNDIFFDVANKSYNSFMNAFTSINNTSYDFASISHEQFEKILDIYLSCMVAPEMLYNENYFKREAINYTLESRDADIEMGGIVFSEDMGYFTNMDSLAQNAVMDTLYPGEVASNIPGNSVNNYELLTYEHTMELYDMCYSFDNSLIVLYGDIDYDSVLSFMDREYLSKAVNKHTDLSQYDPRPSQKAHNDTTVYVPAYIGDTVEGASDIEYAFDLYGMPEQDIYKIYLFADILNNSNSIINKRLHEEGINTGFNCTIDLSCQKPFISFGLSSTSEKVKTKFKEIIDESFDDIISNGCGSNYDVYFEQDEISDAISGGGSDFGINLALFAMNCWANYGNANALSLFSETLQQLKADSNQTELKRLMAEIKNSENQALIAVVPKPGMAEEHLEKMDKYLADMKASMTDEQLDEMIKQTEEYNEWLNTDKTNDDVSIDPKQLPEYTSLPDVKVSKTDDIVTYSAEIDENIGMYQIYFDASTLEKSDIYYLNLFDMLIGSLDTDKYNKNEVSQKMQEFLYGMNSGCTYMQTSQDKSPKLLYTVSWYEYPDKYEEGLEFLLGVLQNTDFTDTDTLINTIESDLPYCDPARSSSPLSVAMQKALTGLGDQYAFNDYINSEEFYGFLSEQLEKLKNDKNYINTLSQKLKEVSAKAIRKDNIIASVAGNKNVIEKVKNVNNELLNNLPSINGEAKSYSFDKAKQKTAYIGEFSQQNVIQAGLCDDDFKGEYIPFVNYISDKYTVPQMRFKNGAYGANTYFAISSKGDPLILNRTGSDPNVGLTLEVLDGTKNVLDGAQITQDELDNYITAAYSELYVPMNNYDKAKESLSLKIMGIDKNIKKSFIDGIKNADVSDKQAAAESIAKIIDNSYSATVGNAASINAEAEYFDSVKDMRNK